MAIQSIIGDIYKVEDNFNTKNELKKSNDSLIIHNGFYEHIPDNLRSKDRKFLKTFQIETIDRKYNYDEKYVYEINGTYIISLSWFDNHKFLFLQRKHWLQKEENIRYIINILLIVVGLIIAAIKI